MSNRDVIVIGGSLGAIAPLKTILAGLPADLPAAVFIVLHIPARAIGTLSTVASAASALPVRVARDGDAIQRGQICLAAPDRHLILADGRIRLGRGPRENMARPAVDPLFRSAAMAFGPRVVGLILSGLLSDGASGLEAVKRCGGMALVQDPADAIADEMPRSALAATAVDLCLPGARLGDVLSDLAREPAGPLRPIPPELRIEVDIAAGERIGDQVIGQLADPAPLTCPACGGVLSAVRGAGSPRFRCQVGHAYAADVLATQQEGCIDEALRVALRIIGERAELVARMARDADINGRRSLTKVYEERAAEYRAYADTIRRAMLRAMDAPSTAPEKETRG
jgi:two-component system chemotaxis response regulator CheB